MTKIQILYPRLDAFVEIMKQKLATPKNQGKLDPRDMFSEDVLALLEREMEELRDAFKRRSAKDVTDECADVANLAMMLADNVSPLPAPPREEGQNNG